MDYPTLASDLTARGYSSGSDPQAVATAMNALTTPVVGLVTTSQVLIWAASNGVLGTLQDISTASSNPLRSAALAVLFATSGGLPGLDLSNAQVQTMVAAFVSASVVTQVMAAELTALGTTTANYCVATYGAPLTATDIIVAFGGSAVTLTPEPTK